MPFVSETKNVAWCLKKRGRQQRSLKFERSLNSLPIKYTALAGGGEGGGCSGVLPYVAYMGRAAGQRMVFGLSVLIRAELIFMRVFTKQGRKLL